MKNLGVKDMSRAGLMAVAMALCAWLSLPVTPPFTMQTFGVFLALCLLGPRAGTLSVAAYLLLGAVGLPVFSGFTGGIGVLFGPNGGYLLGFLLMGPIYGLAVKGLRNSRAAKAAGLGLGLVALYLLGAGWMALQGEIPLYAALLTGALPFLPPDLLKLWLALYLAEKIPLR